jgi:rubredoxin
MSGRFYCKDAICPLCGTEIKTYSGTRHGYIEPRYTFELRSDTADFIALHSGLHCCNNCGYVFAENEDPQKNTNEIIATQAYKTCDGNDFGDENETIKKYYRYGLIHLANNNFSTVFYAFLFGAWISDDYEQKEFAIMFRKKALELYEKIVEKEGKKEGFFLVRADILRRIGEFSKVIEEYSDFDSLNDDRVMIARIQVMLAKDKDDRCHFFPEYSALIS